MSATTEELPAAVPFVVPARVSAPPRFTERHPRLYPVAVKVFQARKHWEWLTSSTPYATQTSSTRLNYRVKEHNALLMRQLSDDEMVLQQGKVTNLRIAAACTDGLLIRPGETFSFNKVVGNCTRRRGFVEGMKLSNGEAESGVGGGICALANLIVWMAMHSPLTIVERSEHSFDPFPDNGRVLPWGVGCSIAWNYVDLVLRNDTEHTFQLHTRVGDRLLEGELRSDTPTLLSYKVFARDEEFLRHGDDVYRRNTICREVIDKRTGSRVETEVLKNNCALVKYLPEGVTIRDVALD